MDCSCSFCESLPPGENRKSSVRRKQKVLRQASRRICNPALKNVPTFLWSADLQSAATKLEPGSCVLGDYKSPGFNRSNIFYGGLQIRRNAWRGHIRRYGNAMIPRAMPWATSFCPFRAWGANRKGAAEIYMLLLPYSFVSSHHRKVSKYTLHLERLQFFFCQSSYLLDLRPRHTYCQQVTGYFQTFR